VDVKGTTLRVEDEGRGPAIILLHSGVADSRMWDPQIRWLSQSHRVVRWDHRGYRDTSNVPGPFSYAADVLSVMDALDIDKATLIGASMGGMMAIRVALMQPARVARLVLIGSNIYGFRSSLPDCPAELAERAQRAEQNGDWETLIDVDIQFWIAGLHRDPSTLDPGFLARSRELLQSTYRPQNGAVLTDVQISDVDRLAQLSMPVLVVVGEEDPPTILDAGKCIAEQAPRAQLVSMPNTAHSPSLEHPEKFNEILADWMRATGEPTISAT
jgi:3-oxoadipate enol-lactonase